MADTTAFVIQLLTTLGAGGVILAVVNSFFSRASRRADPARALVEGNQMFVDRVMQDNVTLRAEMRELKEEQRRQALVVRQSMRYIETLVDVFQEANPNAVVPDMPALLRSVYDERA